MRNLTVCDPCSMTPLTLMLVPPLTLYTQFQVHIYLEVRRRQHAQSVAVHTVVLKTDFDCAENVRKHLAFQ